MSGLRAAFEVQARACAGLGSPFMARLMTLCAERLEAESPVGAVLFGYPGDPGPSAGSLPLRLAGALHGLVLDGSDPGLARVYPPHEADDAAVWAEVSRALGDHAGRIVDWLGSPPQTNEVRRSAALISAAHWIAGWSGETRFTLSELGASGGLNLGFDRYALDAGGQRYGPADPVLTLAPEWSGGAPDPAAIIVTDRAGCDLNPLDPGDPTDRLRLLAYLWPDQPQRLALTRAAIAAARVRPVRADAAAWLARRLAGPALTGVHMVFHTVAWQYFPAETQATCTAALEAAGAGLCPGATLAQVAMEADGGRGAALTVRLWPGGDRVTLARVDFHGRWIAWAAPA